MGKRGRRRSSNGSKQNSPQSALKKPKEGSPTGHRKRAKSSNIVAGTQSVITEAGTAENRSEMGGFGDIGQTDDFITPFIHQNGNQPSKIPPLVVKSVPLGQLKQDLRANGIDAQFKLTRIGIKIVVHTKEAMEATKAYLQRKKAEYFTHDAPEEKPFKAVIRGLPITEKSLIEAELIQHYKLQPVAIHVIARKFSEGDNRDCLYLVHFRKGSTTLNALKAVRTLNDMIVTWEAYRGSHRDVTQCMRCLNFGHGTRNCNLKPRCNICAHPHITADCPHEDVAAYKCVNCGSGHKASDKICPKREAYKQIRKNAATRNLPGRRAPENQQLFRQDEFPALQQNSNQRQQPNVTPSWPRQPRTTTATPSSSQHPVPQVSANAASFPDDECESVPQSGSLYAPEELVRIFLDMSDKLKRCRSRHEQVETLGVFLIQYGR